MVSRWRWLRNRVFSIFNSILFFRHIEHSQYSLKDDGNGDNVDDDDDNNNNWLWWRAIFPIYCKLMEGNRNVLLSQFLFWRSKVEGCFYYGIRFANVFLSFQFLIKKIIVLKCFDFFQFDFCSNEFIFCQI